MLTEQQLADKASFINAFATAQTSCGSPVDRESGLSFFTDFKGNRLLAKGKVLNVDPKSLNPSIKPLGTATTVPVIPSVEAIWDMNGNCVGSAISAFGIQPSQLSLIQVIE